MHLSELDRRPRTRYLIVACLLGLAVPLLLPLQDARIVNAQTSYDGARRLFLHGYLALSQMAAHKGYVQFARSNPDWASKFQVLEAESMEWGGQYDDALRVLADRSPTTETPNAAVHRLTIETVALIRRNRTGEAEQRLAEADSICRSQAVAACGEVIRARGLLAMSQRRLADAGRLFQESLSFARAHSDPSLEATAELNLSAAMSQQERYDEALDWSESAYKSAEDAGDENLMEAAQGNSGWAHFRLGDAPRALDLFLDSEKRAERIGNIRARLVWMSTAGNAYLSGGDIENAAKSYRQSLQLAKRIDDRPDTIDSLEDLAHASIDANKLDDAQSYLRELEPLIAGGENHLDQLDVTLIRGRIAAARREDEQAKELLTSVDKDPAAQVWMRLGAEHEMARLYEAEGDAKQAEGMYRTALATFESARKEIQREDSKLPFLSNAASIYDDFIHFLVEHGRADEALAVADQSRARTLLQGLGEDAETARAEARAEPKKENACVGTTKVVPLRVSNLSGFSGTCSGGAMPPAAIAKKAGGTLLFYWLGDRQSYLWAITPQKTALFNLPPQREIAPRVERYRRAVLGPLDPLETANEDGRALYKTLVAPAAALIGLNAPVFLLTDGPLSQLNFETLLAPGGSGSGAMGNGPDAGAAVAAVPLHYWIDDVTLISAPSLSMLAASQPPSARGNRLLLIGNAVAPNKDYPQLAQAGEEMRQIEKHFAARDATVFDQQRANPDAYLRSSPAQYAYIHFVTHGVASRSDPLDSAIILSRQGEQEDSFKLHARDIMHHRIDARLVTISACYGSGARALAGEGLVGLSWAFLRAGAHNVVAALWEASDESTPALMDGMYAGLEQGLAPGEALRRAKLNLLHSSRGFRKPFYWGAFQVYAGR